MAAAPVRTIAIDATYIVDSKTSGISVYSRRLIESLGELETPHRFLVAYRLSRWRRRSEFIRPARSGWHRRSESSRYSRMVNCLFQEPWTFWLRRRAELFHSLAQRPAPFRFRHEVVTVHDAFPLTGRDYSDPGFLRKFSALLLEAVSRSERVIVPSQATADQLIRHADVDAKKIRMIPEGVDPVPEPLSPIERLRERERWVGAGNELVLVVGVIQTRKNTLGALKALERLPENYRMILAGASGYGCEPALRYAGRAALAGRAIVAGHVDGPTLWKLYESASILLFPSFEEGFGLPVLEAMAHRLPVVASNTSSLPEVGGDAVLYADPSDEKALASQVRRAAENEALRTSMASAGLARAKEFTWRKTAEQTLAVYEELIGRL
jgi:glycosyltransferase involved in cell wall biosynthesis